MDNFFEQQVLYQHMNIENFLEYVKKNNCRISLGKQEALYNTVSKYGYEDHNTYSAINQCCPPKFRQTMKLLIKVIPLEEKAINIKQILQSFTLKFINERFVEPKDYVRLVSSIRYLDKQSIQKITTNYGIKQEFQKELNQLIKSIQQVQKTMRSSTKKKQWKIFEEQLLKEMDVNSIFLLSVFLQGEMIENAQKLRILAQKCRIFIIKDKEFRLFDVVNNLGMKHQLAQNTIKSSTYLAFQKLLYQLSQKIVQRRSQFAWKQIIEEMVNKLLNQLMLTFEDSLALIKYSFIAEGEELNKIVYQYGLQDFIQQIKFNLLKLVSHLKEEFQKYEIEIIIKYSQELLQSIKEKMNISQIDIKSEINRIKDYLKKEFMLEEADSNKLILSFYQNSFQQFDEIVYDYGLNDDKGTIIKIKEQLNHIIIGNATLHIQDISNILSPLPKKQDKHIQIGGWWIGEIVQKLQAMSLSGQQQITSLTLKVMSNK